ncbi:MAG: pre-toxin TG domain-containing protein [Deltaproteobacteria bacterium]
MLLSVLVVLAWRRPVAAQPTRQLVATDAGVSVAVPAGLRAAQALAPLPDLPPQVEGLATFTDDSNEPLNIQVRKGAPHGWKSLPAASSAVAAEWARRFAAELQVPEAYDFKPGRYDPERGALSLQYKVVGPSFARLMQRLPEAHPLWAPTLEAGEDPKNAKCLLDALLAGQGSAAEPQLRARVQTAARACSLTEAMVGEYLQQLGAAEFAPSVTTVTYLAFFTRLGTIGTLVMAPVDRQSAVDEAAEVVFRETEVADDARLPVESSTDWFRVAQLAGIVLGSLLGVLLLGGGLSWGLVRLGVRAPLAVGGALGLLCALSLSGLLRAGAIQLEGSLQFGGYLLGGALAFRPLVRWLSSRGGGGPLLRRARSLRRARGLSTVEYVIVLVLLACVAIGTWHVFGQSVRGALSNSTQQLDGLANIPLDDRNSGPGGSPRDPTGGLGQTSTEPGGNDGRASNSGSRARGDGRGTPQGGGSRGAAQGAGSRGTAQGAGGPGATTPNSGGATEPRGSASQGAATGALQGLQPGRVVPPVARPELPTNAGRVAASGAQEPSWLLRGTDIATDFVPWVSNAKDATIAVSGVNPITGEKVGTLGRVMAGVFAVPVAGNALKYVGKGGKYVLKGGKAAYEAIEVARAGSKIAKGVERTIEREVVEGAAQRAEKELAERAEKELAQRAEKEAAERAAEGGAGALRKGAGTTANPKDILFSQPTISQNFSDGHTLNQTVEALRSGKLKPTDLPPIRVVEKDGKLITLDNRRLAAFEAAGVKEIPVQRVSLSDPKIAKEFDKKFRPVNGGRHVVVVENAAGHKEAERVLGEHGKIPKK